MISEMRATGTRLLPNNFLGELENYKASDRMTDRMLYSSCELDSGKKAAISICLKLGF
jgi:hypothetical protein